MRLDHLLSKELSGWVSPVVGDGLVQGEGRPEGWPGVLMGGTLTCSVRSGLVSGFLCVPGCGVGSGGSVRCWVLRECDALVYGPSLLACGWWGGCAGWFVVGYRCRVVVGPAGAAGFRS